MINSLCFVFINKTAITALLLKSLKVYLKWLQNLELRHDFDISLTVRELGQLKNWSLQIDAGYSNLPTCQSSALHDCYKYQYFQYTYSYLLNE